jgi:Holliday junction resolvase RusA-like endonuclease
MDLFSADGKGTMSVPEMSDPLTPWSGSVTVYGPAQTQGSKTVFMNKYTKRPVLVEANEKNLRPWRTQAVSEMRACKPDVPFDQAMFAKITVYVRRPSAHFRSNGMLKPNAPKYPKVGKDQDKIARACLDAMKIGGWVQDDSRFADILIKRRYDEEERVVIEACPLDADVNQRSEEEAGLFNLKGEGPSPKRKPMKPAGAEIEDKDLPF